MMSKNIIVRWLLGTHRKKMLIGVLLLIFLMIVTFEDGWYTRKSYTFKTFHVEEQDPEITKMLKHQKCRIPVINPFNPEILPHLVEPDMKKCRLKRYGVVKGDELTIDITEIEVVELGYIERLSDFENSIYLHILPINTSQTESFTYKVEKEFFKLRIIFIGDQDIHEEFHAAFIPNKNDNARKTDQDEQLNILILMFDSISNAHAQRSLTKSYRYLKENKRTVFMKGQSIVGDGTTAQLCAMLTGIPEYELPEARRGRNNSDSVDRWPWLFKDLHAKNYKTFFSEHDVYAATFNYRLYGFDEPPTSHYLRPLFIAMERLYQRHSFTCPHKFNFEYTRRFFDTYKEYNKFGFIANNLAHNTLSTLENADDDIVGFYEWLESSEHSKNTLVILMGDHGQRTSSFRSTLQGKLEERLPLLAITYPSKYDSYSVQLKNLRRNSHLLTSHFDTYATLQHLLTFPKFNRKVKSKYGKSLFSKLETLNRTCSDAGVAKHWCTCLNYERVDPDKDPNVVKLAKTVVTYMNHLNSARTSKCSELKLQSVTRSGRRTPADEVNQFLQTETAAKGCDSCEVKYSGNKKVTRFEYEIEFSVSPSGGTYEVTGEVVYKEKNVYITHSTDISRTNLYGSQPDCIAKIFPNLRKFCFCAA